MQIKELMTKNVLTIPADSRINDILDMFENNRIHHIPVIGSDGEIIGMLSDKDIQNYTKLVNTLKMDKNLKVKDLMTSPIFSYYDSVEINQAAKAMLDNKIHAIIVVNQREEMVGILTSTDILRFVSEKT